MEQHTAVSVESTDPKSPYYGQTLTMYEANFGTQGDAKLMRTHARHKWHICPICSLEYPEEKMFKYRGTWYCKDGYEEMVNSAIKDRRVANDL